MAMRSDNDFPELVPFDDRLPSRAGLFRRPEEVTDDQFSLLAAEWAEGDAGADIFSEIETIFAASPSRKSLAEDFKRIRLVPFDEKWTGSSAMIKITPAAVYMKRVIYGTVAAAAVFIAFITLSPLYRNTALQSSPPILPAVRITADAVSPAGESHPVTGTNVAAVLLSSGSPEPQEPPAVNPPADAKQSPRIQPLDFRNDPETVRLIADAGAEVSAFAGTSIAAGTGTLRATSIVAGNTSLNDPDSQQVIQSSRPVPRETNWIIRGIANLSGIVSGKDKPVDGYLIAGACVKGINTVLGWEMDLERVVSDEGNPLAVNFSSSLLSFSAPVKKSADEP